VGEGTTPEDTTPVQMDLQQPTSIKVVQKHFAPLPPPYVPQTMNTAQTNAEIIA
jgi:hypothetical protein